MANSDDWLHRFNTGTESVTAAGTVDIEHGQSWPTRLLATLLGLPPPVVAEPARVHVARRIEGASVHERWIRTFGTVDLVTRQIRVGERIDERIGPIELRICCHATAFDVWFLPAGAALILGRWRLRLPAALTPRAVAHAWSSATGAFDVDVSIRIPLLGIILSYRGHFIEVEE